MRDDHSHELAIPPYKSCIRARSWKRTPSNRLLFRLGKGWNRLNAGKPAKKAIFVDVDDAHLNRVEISGALSQLPAEVRMHIEASRAQRKERLAAAVPRMQDPPTIDVPAVLHKSVVPTIRVLEKAKPDTAGTVRASGAGLCHIEVAASSVKRVAAFLDILVRSLETKALNVEVADGGVVIPRGKDSVVFNLKEKTRRQKHEPTAAELEAEAKREKRRQQYWSGAGRDVDYNSVSDRAYPEFDTVQTGALVFEIEGYGTGLRQTWADGKTQTVETLLDSIVTGIDAILTLRRIQREEREERERQWAELSRRRDLAKKRKERERQRLAYWRAIARTHREIEMLRRWIESNRVKSDQGPTNNVDRMIVWTRARLSTLEESISVVSVNGHLESRKLFPEIDELIDPLGEPPEEPRYSWQR